VRAVGGDARSADAGGGTEARTRTKKTKRPRSVGKRKRAWEQTPDRKGLRHVAAIFYTLTQGLTVYFLFSFLFFHLPKTPSA
jgi:hypothetical protein